MHVAISLTEGRLLRDLFYHGYIDCFRRSGHSITVFSEAATIPSFVDQWKSESVEFKPLVIPVPKRRANIALALRHTLASSFSGMLLKPWLRFEMSKWYPPRREYEKQLAESKTKVLVATNVHLPWEAELISSARELGIPTLGLVKSWDNVHKGLWSRTDKLAVWNDINKSEVVKLEGYNPNDVFVIGPPAFDTYFSQDIKLSREEFATRFNLDPNRPIILFATLGYFIPHFDETCWMEDLVKIISSGSVPNRPQVICRLHPWSRLEHFQKFAEHPDVRLSWVDRYIPGLTWFMTKEDVILFANMLIHADVVITPGSTLVLEAAIFDRPTVMPIFHQYQPERAADYFRTWVVGKHYAHIVKNDLVPIVRERESFLPMIQKALADPGWYREQRGRLVRDYVQFTDGRATERFAELAVTIGQDGTSY